MKYPIESAIEADFGDFLSCRFQDLDAYKKLCSSPLKEMDFSWREDEKLFILELKNYYNLPESLDEIQFQHDVLISKIVDVLLMLSSMARNTEVGKNLISQSNKVFEQYQMCKFICALNWPGNTSQIKSLLGPVSDKIKAQLKSKLSLFDNHSVIVIDYDSLINWRPTIFSKGV